MGHLRFDVINHSTPNSVRPTRKNATTKPWSSCSASELPLYALEPRRHFSLQARPISRQPPRPSTSHLGCIRGQARARAGPLALAMALDSVWRGFLKP